MWIFIVICGHFFNALAFLIDKYLLSSKIPHPLVYSFTIGVLGLFAFLFAPFGLEILPKEELLVSFISGATFILALNFFFRALQKGDTLRVVTFVGATQPIIIFLLAFFYLGERLAQKEFFGFVLLLLGGIFITRENKSTSKRLFSFWVKNAFFSALLFAISFVLIKDVFNETNFLSGLIWSRLGGGVMAGMYLLIPKFRRILFEGFLAAKEKKKTGSLVFLGQVSGGIGFILFSYAISLASVTLVQATQGIQYGILFIIILFLSWKFPNILHETLETKTVIQKVFAIFLISIGLIFGVL